MVSYFPQARRPPAMFCLLHCIAALALIPFPVSGVRGNHGNETDRLALLQFKAKITVDPEGVLTSWNSSHHFCQWYGVTCGRRHQRVTSLDLRFGNLSGTISPHIGNLSFLSLLFLRKNNFHSTIPLEVGRLSRLRGLYLSNNSLSGPIPPSLSNCSNLIYVDLQVNMLNGSIPPNLGFLSKLFWISLEDNVLDGIIPFSFGNMSSMEYLWMNYNELEGRIPDTLSNLKSLKELRLGANDLVGNVPSSITNISYLESLDLGGNYLDGILPWDLGISLPNLQFLSVAENQFTGPIPISVSNLSNLYFFQFALNNFSEDVPSFRKMSKLSRFTIAGNNLGSGKANDLDFLCSLTNSSNLTHLDASRNNFRGTIPRCIGNLSRNLIKFSLSQNALSGSLPSSIGNLINLEIFSLTLNHISGIIPPQLGNLGNLKQLYLALCEFTGKIPDTLGNLTLAIHMVLKGNNLLGTIPSNLSNCQSLQLLDLSDNRLSGAIPPEIMSISSLSIYADFSNNNLAGELPAEMGNLKNLNDLRLNSNKLSGEIPTSLGSCISLEYLYMQDNMFAGPIPSTLSSLKGIQILNFSDNRLSGQIPHYLEDMPLTSLGLAFNEFEGPLPVKGIFANSSATSVEGNEKLCGGLPEFQLPICKMARSTRSRVRTAVICSVSGVLGIVLFILFLYGFWKRKERKAAASSPSNNGFLKVSYQSLLKATEGFSSTRMIGKGSFGTVFGGVLDQNDTAVAIKVLDLTHCGASRSFIAECEALRNIRHRNLVKVLTACSGSDYQGNEFKALVYEFMVNGSLDEWLHPQARANGVVEDAPRQLGLLQRVNIAMDIACALDYLHHQCETPIVHCDLKPGNVLLDDEMTGHVGDFGLVKLLPEATREFISDQISSVGLRGSLGYIAPEYGAGGDVSTYGDVYSYGILLLEIFTGKRPTNDMFIDGMNLHSYAKAALPEQVLLIVDPSLLQECCDQESSREVARTPWNNSRFPKIQECLISIVEIGVACSSELPGDRMNMSHVVAALQATRKKLHAAY